MTHVEARQNVCRVCAQRSSLNVSCACDSRPRREGTKLAKVQICEWCRVQYSPRETALLSLKRERFDAELSRNALPYQRPINKTSLEYLIARISSYQGLTLALSWNVQYAPGWNIFPGRDTGVRLLAARSSAIACHTADEWGRFRSAGEDRSCSCIRRNMCPYSRSTTSSNTLQKFTTRWAQQEKKSPQIVKRNLRKKKPVLCFKERAGLDNKHLCDDDDDDDDEAIAEECPRSDPRGWCHLVCS